MKQLVIQKKLALIVLASLLSLQAGNVLAKTNKTIEDCKNKTETQIDYSFCLDGLREHAERELTTWVNNQTFTLKRISTATGRSSVLNIFKRSQSNFEKFRENNCRWQYLAYAPDDKAVSAYKECFIQLTFERSKELAAIGKE